MDHSLEGILLLAFVSFLAGFVDAVVGGGGLVQVPAMFIILPHWGVAQIIGTNRFASFSGTSISAYQYLRKVTIPIKIILVMALFTAITSYSGALVSNMVKASLLKPIMFFLMLLIWVYSYFKKDLGAENIHKSNAHLYRSAIFIGIILGFYNGFLGPGTGSLLVFAFVSILGFEFLKASASSKLINLTADISSLIFFLSAGKVIFAIALPMAAANIFGGYLGSRLAILKGSGFIRQMFLLIILGLLLRFAWDVFVNGV
jgi:uncharacterized protein